MQPKNNVFKTLGIFAAMAMLPAVQSAPASAASQDDSSPRVVRSVSPQLRPVAPRISQPAKATPVPGQFERPVITEPVSNTDTCCWTGNRWSGDDSTIETEFHVAGTGVPGHRIQVWAHFHNDGSSSLIKRSSATVDADGRWTARFFKVTRLNPADSPYIEITATQYFAPARVREPEGEGHALPVILKYQKPTHPPFRGYASPSGG